ncbi:MAG: recombinase family protein [Phycisphaeraceae bacterium]|nr:recombinase family protein [Phycisphaeraceae bacterium]
MSKRPEPKPTTRVRCAIYTRKSSQDGLEQEFNSLDAQRESAEAYIASQKAEGWQCLPERYDDGGFIAQQDLARGLACHGSRTRLGEAGRAPRSVSLDPREGLGIVRPVRPRLRVDTRSRRNSIKKELSEPDAA